MDFRLIFIVLFQALTVPIPFVSVLFGSEFLRVAWCWDEVMFAKRSIASKSIDLNSHWHRYQGSDEQIQMKDYIGPVKTWVDLRSWSKLTAERCMENDGTCLSDGFMDSSSFSKPIIFLFLFNTITRCLHNAFVRLIPVFIFVWTSQASSARLRFAIWSWRKSYWVRIPFFFSFPPDALVCAHVSGPLNLQMAET